MDAAVQLLEGLPCDERFVPATTSILHGQYTAFYDAEGIPGVIMPGEYLAGAIASVRTVTVAGPLTNSDWGMVPTAKYDGACRIRDDTGKNDDAEADYQRQLVSQMVNFHVRSPFTNKSETIATRFVPAFMIFSPFTVSIEVSTC